MMELFNIISTQEPYSEIISKGEYFIKKGQINNKLGIIKKGILRYYLTDSNGNEIDLNYHKENDIITGSVTPNAPALASIVAIEKCNIDILNYEKIISMVIKDEKLFKKYAELLDLTFSSIHNRIISFIGLNAMDRYKFFLHEYPLLINRIPNYYIANFLGITPTQLSRIRKEYVKE